MNPHRSGLAKNSLTLINVIVSFATLGSRRSSGTSSRATGRRIPANSGFCWNMCSYFSFRFPTMQTRRSELHLQRCFNDYMESTHSSYGHIVSKNIRVRIQLLYHGTKFIACECVSVNQTKDFLVAARPWRQLKVSEHLAYWLSCLKEDLVMSRNKGILLIFIAFQILYLQNVFDHFYAH